MVILCDVDGVVADLHPAWYRLYNEACGDTLRPEDVKTWDTHLYAKHGSRVYDFLYAPELYFHVEPVVGAHAGIMALRQRGHRIVYVSSCVDHMIDPKVGWLKHHGFLTNTGRSYNDFVAVNDKTLIAGDTLIEDSLANVVAWTDAHQRRAVLLDRPWNRETDVQSSKVLWFLRVKTWLKIPDAIEGI